MRTGHGWCKRWILSILGCAVVGMVAVGCQSTFGSLQGARLQDGYGIAIEQGVEKGGNYQTRDLTIRYQYHYDSSSGQFKIDGKVVFQDAIQMNFAQVSGFNVGLVFADADRAVLARYSLKSEGFLDPNNGVQFNVTLTAPAGSSLIAFTYQGNAEEGGAGPSVDTGSGGNGISTSFWEYPIVR